MLYSIIKNLATDACLVWKFPQEDFNNNSQLIVSESEEALFYKDGVIVQTYSGGKYTLDTNNIPFIRKLIQKMSGGISAFNCKVFFISKTHRMDIKWGTESPIPMRDALFGFAVGIRARGAYTVQVKDPKKFLLKMLGTNVQAFTNQELNNCFRTAFQSSIKVLIANVMKRQNKTILDMATEYENLAQELHPKIDVTLDEYGLRCVNFYINDISIPEDDPNYKKINEAYAFKGARDVQGISWQQEQSVGILRDLANNPGAGGIGAMGAGMGMGFAAGGVFGNLANQIFTPMNNGGTQNTTGGTSQATAGASRYASASSAPSADKCPHCDADIALDSAFCSKCGKPLGTVCPKCGEKLKIGSRFCNKCGASI
jgi:membrane protease subunit (stomatin/prohibitin family)